MRARDVGGMAKDMEALVTTFAGPSGSKTSVAAVPKKKAIPLGWVTKTSKTIRNPAEKAKKAKKIPTKKAKVLAKKKPEKKDIPKKSVKKIKSKKTKRIPKKKIASKKVTLIFFHFSS